MMRFQGKAGSRRSESRFSASIPGGALQCLQPRLCWPPSGRPVWDLLLACPLQLGTIPQPSSLISGHGVRTPEVTDPTTVRPLCSAGSGPPPP